MTDTRAADLIAKVRELDKAATPATTWGGENWAVMDNPDREIGQIPEWYVSCEGIGSYPIAYVYEKGDAAFIAFSRTALPDLATLAEQAIALIARIKDALRTGEDGDGLVEVARNAAQAEFEHAHIAAPCQIDGCQFARAEKAEADLAEARRMLKEADNQIAWDHAARGVTVKFPGTHIALEAIARHQAREGR